MDSDIQERKFWEENVDQIRQAFSKAANCNPKSEDDDEIGEIAVLIFQSFLYWTHAVFCQEAFKFCNNDINTSLMASCLISIINSKLPDIGEEAIYYFIYKFLNGIKTGNRHDVVIASTLLADCYRQRVIDHILINQVIIALLNEKRTYISHTIDLLFRVAPCIYEEDNTSEKLIFQALNDFSEDKDAAKRLRQLTMWRQREYKGYHRIPKEFDKIEEEEQNCHTAISLPEELEDPIKDFIMYHQIPNIEQLKDEYDEFLKELLPDEEEEEEENEKPNAGLTSNQESVKDIQEALNESAQNKEIMEIKRATYLTIVSNATSDATAHSLIKLAEQKGEKFEPVIMEICIDYVGMNRTFDRNLGVLIQLICRAQPRYITYVCNDFQRHYNDCHKYGTKRVLNLGCLYAYLLSNDTIPWTVLSIIKLTAETTTSAQRVFLRYIFEELAKIMSHVSLVQKLAEPEVIEATSNIFLTDTLEHAEFVDTYFEVINLDFVCERVNRAILIMKNQIQS